MFTCINKVMKGVSDAMEGLDEAIDKDLDAAMAQVAGGVTVTVNQGHVVITGPVKSVRVNDAVLEFKPKPEPGV